MSLKSVLTETLTCFSGPAAAVTTGGSAHGPRGRGRGCGMQSVRTCARPGSHTHDTAHTVTDHGMQSGNGLH